MHCDKYPDESSWRSQAGGGGRPEELNLVECGRVHSGPVSGV